MFLILLFVYAESFDVIIRDQYPMSKCDGTGYEVELLVKAFSNFGLTENQDFQLICETSYDDTIETLGSGNAIAVGGLAINSTFMKDGIYFSYPTYTSGLNILVNNQSSGGIWKLFKVFQQEIWILIVISPLIIGLASWGYSIIVNGQIKEGVMNFELLQELVWNSYSG